MILYIAFGPLYRFPTSMREDYLGYGYNLDKEKYCKRLGELKACKNAANVQECEKEISDLSGCMGTVDEWLHSLNETCYEEINSFESCIDEQKTCLAELNSLTFCEESLKKPEWLDPKHISHWNHIYESNTN